MTLTCSSSRVLSAEEIRQFDPLASPHRSPAAKRELESQIMPLQEIQANSSSNRQPNKKGKSQNSPSRCVPRSSAIQSSCKRISASKIVAAKPRFRASVAVQKGRFHISRCSDSFHYKSIDRSLFGDHGFDPKFSVEVVLASQAAEQNANILAQK